MKTKILLKKLISRLLAYFPSKLPTGMTDFNIWADSVIELSGMPHNDSVVFSLATMILHLPSTASSKSKEYFIRSINKAAANQIAAGVMQDLKHKQAAAHAAEQAESAKQAEAPKSE